MHEHDYTDRADRLVQPCRVSSDSKARDAAKQHLIAREFQQRPDVMIVRCA